MKLLLWILEWRLIRKLFSQRRAPSAVNNKLQEVRETKFLFKICPNHELSTSKVPKWIASDVEVVPLDSERSLDTVASSSKVVFSTASGNSKGKDPATPDQGSIDNPLHAMNTTPTPAYTRPPFSNTVRDSAGPKQPMQLLVDHQTESLLLSCSTSTILPMLSWKKIANRQPRKKCLQESRKQTKSNIRPNLGLMTRALIESFILQQVFGQQQYRILFSCFDL